MTASDEEMALRGFQDYRLGRSFPDDYDGLTMLGQHSYEQGRTMAAEVGPAALVKLPTEPSYRQIRRAWHRSKRVDGE